MVLPEARIPEKGVRINVRLSNCRIWLIPEPRAVAHAVVKEAGGRCARAVMWHFAHFRLHNVEKDRSTEIQPTENSHRHNSVTFRRRKYYLSEMLRSAVP